MSYLSKIYCEKTSRNYLNTGTWNMSAYTRSVYSHSHTYRNGKGKQQHIWSMCLYSWEYSLLVLENREFKKDEWLYLTFARRHEKYIWNSKKYSGKYLCIYWTQKTWWKGIKKHGNVWQMSNASSILGYIICYSFLWE